MSNDVQRLHDAVLKLGDAALEIAEALSAFKDEELEGGEFKRPGDPKPAPASTNIKAGEALTPERFQKLVTAVDEPPPPPVEKSYITGKPLGDKTSARRIASRKGANLSCYDLEHWSRRVRYVREKEFGIKTGAMGKMLGVSANAIMQWEAGICFATREHRRLLETIAHTIADVPLESWKRPA